VRFGDQFAVQPMSERVLRTGVVELYSRDTALGGRALKSRRWAREAIAHLFVEGETVGPAPGSKCCAWNAIVEYRHRNGRTRTTEGAFVRRVEDPVGSGLGCSSS
jgi:hypothetical protein